MNWEVSTMRSKTSFFNGTLYKKNLARFWPLWGGAALLGSLFPLTLWMYYIRWGAEGNPLSTAAQAAEMYAEVAANILPVLSLLYALPCALAVWSYLNNARSVGLMHRLPIRREGLFVTNLLSGLSMMLIPYVVVGVLCISLNMAMGTTPWDMVLKTVLSVLGESFFYFATATLAAFLTGNNFAMPVVYFLLHFLQPIVCLLAGQLQESFYYGVLGNVNVAGWLCPTAYLMTNMDVDDVYEDVRNSQGYLDYVLTEVGLKGFALVGLYALAGLVILALAYGLYRRRNSERAGDVAAFAFLRPVYRLGGGLLAALGGGMILYYLFWNPFVERFGSFTPVETLPLLVCMVLAGLVGYYAISMVLEKSLRVFTKKSLPGAAVLLSLCVIICLVYRYDLAGVESYVPQASKVESVAVQTREDLFTFRAGEQDALLEEALGLHQKLVDDLDQLKGERFIEYTEEGESIDTQTQLEFTYYLRNGQIVQRYYYDIEMNVKDFTQPDSLAASINALVNRSECKLMRLKVDDPQVTLQKAVAYPSGDNGNNGDRVELTATEAQRFQQAVAEDAKAGRWGQEQWFSEDLVQEIERDQDFYRPEDVQALKTWMSGKGEVFAKVEVFYERTEEVQGRQHRYYSSYTILVRPEMSSTIAALRELGVLEADSLTIIPDQEEWEIGGNVIPRGPFFSADGYRYPEETQWEIQDRLRQIAEDFSGDPEGYRQMAFDMLLHEYGMDLAEVQRLLDASAGEKTASAAPGTPAVASVGVIGGADGSTEVYVTAG